MSSSFSPSVVFFLSFADNHHKRSSHNNDSQSMWYLSIHPSSTFLFVCKTLPDPGMGLDSNQFAETVDENFICGICLNVLEDPVTTPCEHTFCLNMGFC